MVISAFWVRYDPYLVLMVEQLKFKNFQDYCIILAQKKATPSLINMTKDIEEMLRMEKTDELSNDSQKVIMHHC